MQLNELLDTLPGYAKDLKLNLSNLLQQPELTKQQIWGTAVACAVAARNPHLVEAVAAEASNHVSPQIIEAAKGAAAIMGMNNIYYRFQHLTSNQKYATLPARLRMNIIRSHGVDQADFELWCVAVSAINACGTCVDSHEKVVREKGLSEDAILGSVRIAAVVHGLAAVLDGEPVLASEALPV